MVHDHEITVYFTVCQFHFDCVVFLSKDAGAKWMQLEDNHVE